VRRTQRRGYMLIQLLFLLPIIAAMSTVTYRLSARIMRFETVAYRQMARCAIWCGVSGKTLPTLRRHREQGIGFGWCYPAAR